MSIQSYIDGLSYAEQPAIPESRHGSLHYGAHWSRPHMGASGYAIQHRGYWFRCQQRRDLSWGTARQARRDISGTTVTLREFRVHLNDIIDNARKVQ